MKILITGAGGMLGSDIAAALSPDFDAAGITHHEAPHLSIASAVADLANPKEAGKAIQSFKPSLIIHTAAMTDVDGCERDRQGALKNNFEATKHVVNAALACGAGLVFYTTDYIFDGHKKGEYTETDVPHPLNTYGESKYLAETYIRSKMRRFLIFRVGWLYGLQGRSFPKTILEKTENVRVLDVVNDQIGRPTHTWDLASVLRELLSREEGLEKYYGETFNLANYGVTSWYDFARFIVQTAGREDVNVRPVSTVAGMRPALRPLNSVLSLDKAERILRIKLRSWQDASSEFIREFLAQKKVGSGS